MHTGLVLRQRTDRRDDERVERQKEGVRQTAPAADAIGHLHIELVLVEERSAITRLAAVRGRRDGAVPETGPDLLQRGLRLAHRCSQAYGARPLKMPAPRGIMAVTTLEAATAKVVT